MAAGDLTSAANAAAWVGNGVLNTDPVLARLITAVSAQIKQFLSIEVLSATYTETYSGTGSTRQMLRNAPVTAVASVLVDGVSIPAAISAVQPGFVFDDISVALRGYRFCRGVQNIEVTYTAGWATVPFDIEQAALDWIKAIWERQDRPADVTEQRAGDTEQRFTNGMLTVGGRLVAPMPGAIAAALLPYQRVFPV